MNLPSYQECKSLEENSIPYWMNYFRENSKLIDVYQYGQNMTIQKEEHWDLLIILKGNSTPLRIDVKTRSEKYYNYYNKDHKILVETDGNTSGSTGSSVYNSNADLWAYAFFDGIKLIEPLVYWRKPFAQWLTKTVTRFETRISNTDNLYQTENKLIHRDFFKPFEWKNN